jgi:indolepyruvate ferredoxin oxidoreductase
MTALMTENAKPSKLEDRYERESGDVFLTGIQALIRLTIDQNRRDARAGLKIGGFITGYPGSPLGGMEGSLGSVKPLLQQFGIRHMPAQNEELAATSLIGTQMLDDHPHPDYDGVVGYWYGKGPGVDRSGDALKHGNFAGTSKHGAVVVLSGEDHEAKSSTVPYQQEFSFEHFGIPVIYPATVAEFLTFGQHAVAMSRYSGCWVAMKLTGPVCDGGETVRIEDTARNIVIPSLEIDGKPFVKTTNFKFFPGLNIATEHDLYYHRHAAVRAYARANGLDRITVRSANDRIGIVAAGKAYTDTRQALRDLGWSDEKLRQAGIRLLKLGLLCPMESGIVKEFAEGLEDVIVIEEKRDFIERQIGRILCELTKVPRLTGKFDRQGKPLFPIEGGMDHDQIARLLGRILADRLPEAGCVRLTELEQIHSREVVAHPRRTPSYCSGCPHNTGTKLAPGQIAWGAPGCHVFATIMPEPTRRIEAVTQFGGEGLPWIGLAPFTSREHIIQNVGDGSLFHSSYLNIRYAIAAGVRITFKILYNGAIANTGGQPPVGQRTVPQLAQLLATEGVARIILVAKDRSLYKRGALPPMVEIRDPDDIEAAQKELEATEGVTILIYDGQCANERRRRQKRGKVPKPSKFVLVNEDVCENCGHCGEVSSCMSLQKIDTEFGKKTAIHQSSCNQDMSCLKGECPSFVTVQTEAGKGVRRPPLPVIADDFAEVQQPLLDRPYQICIPGVGGTGVITVNAILAQAATLDGNRALSFDQTGAAQKWGPVLSSLIVSPRGDLIDSNMIGVGRADLYLALDLLAAADRTNLMRCRPAHTAAVVNASLLPTGAMIRDVRLKVLADPIVDSIYAVVDAKRSVALDARTIAERLFGDYMMTNMVAVGAAYQAGLLPISAAAVEQAIALNKVQVQANIAAFRAGRLFMHDPARLNALIRQPYVGLADRVSELVITPSRARSAARDALLATCPDLDPETRRLLATRIEDLIDYQSGSYAQRYVEVVRQVAAAERRFGGGAAAARALTRAVIRNLHKLMAYKDEYEVARLLTQRTFRERALARFEGRAKLSFNLQPPLLRHFGMNRKVSLGEWFAPVLKLLAALRFVRGTPLDIFGYAAIRRVERRLVDWYVDLILQTLPALRSDNIVSAIAIAELPDDIRGYEEIKMKNVAQVQERVAPLLAALQAAPELRLSA